MWGSPAFLEMAKHGQFFPCFTWKRCLWQYSITSKHRLAVLHSKTVQTSYIYTFLSVKYSKMIMDTNLPTVLCVFGLEYCNELFLELSLKTVKDFGCWKMMRHNSSGVCHQKSWRHPYSSGIICCSEWLNFNGNGAVRSFPYRPWNQVCWFCYYFIYF